MNSVEQLIESIKQKAGINDVDTQALVVSVAVDTMMLQSRALAGEDVSHEFAIVEATALTLDEHVRRIIGNEILSWIQAHAVKALAVAITT